MSVATVDASKLSTAHILRRIVCQRDTASPLVVSFFPADAPAAVQQMHSEAQCSSLHFATPTNFRVAATNDDALPRFVDVQDAAQWPTLPVGSGVMFGAHGLTVGYGLWQSKFVSAPSDAEHASYGVLRSVAARLVSSTEATLPGPAVLHATSRARDAAALAAALDPAVDGRVRDALALGVIRAPLVAISGEVVSDESFETGSAGTRLAEAQAHGAPAGSVR
jgi:hypothetical protein